MFSSSWTPVPNGSGDAPAFPLLRLARDGPLARTVTMGNLYGLTAIYLSSPFGIWTTPFATGNGGLAHTLAHSQGGLLCNSPFPSIASCEGGQGRTELGTGTVIRDQTVSFPSSTRKTTRCHWL